jgi:hypothetical protein
LTNVDLLKVLDAAEIDVVRKATADRGDATAIALRKTAIGKIMKWVLDNDLKKHQGFFLSYLNGTKSVKTYMMDYDGKELYQELIKEFKPLIKI